MELVSVLVAVYNSEEYLSKCVNSIRNQSYQNLEIILVNDGSTDHSGEMCDMFQKEDSRIKAVHKKNGGLATTRNTGVANASGDYICFVDGDDYLAPDYVETLLHAIKETKSDVAWCHYLKFWDHVEKSEKPDSGVTRICTKEELWNYLMITGPNPSGILFIVTWGKMIKSEVVKRLHFPEGIWHEDEFYIHRLLTEAKQFAEVDRSLYYYRQRPDSYVGAKNKLNPGHLDVLDAFEERIQFGKKQLHKDGYHKLIRAYRNNLYILYHTFISDKKVCKALKRRLLISWKKYLFTNLTDLKQSVIFWMNPKWYFKKYWDE